jgi:hypothetical protein
MAAKHSKTGQKTVRFVTIRKPDRSLVFKGSLRAIFSYLNTNLVEYLDPLCILLFYIEYIFLVAPFGA